MFRTELKDLTKCSLTPPPWGGQRPGPLPKPAQIRNVTGTDHPVVRTDLANASTHGAQPICGHILEAYQRLKICGICTAMHTLDVAGVLGFLASAPTLKDV